MMVTEVADMSSVAVMEVRANDFVIVANEMPVLEHNKSFGSSII